uniref:Uncharacterized protein n=1 Tax=Vespula pensylvanica TaxID=30213 RepID=A0A834NDH9_VESPE|nr:hypothetical protein H0235_014768 [Vespula pensylvanica]
MEMKHLQSRNDAVGFVSLKMQLESRKPRSYRWIRSKEGEGNKGREDTKIEIVDRIDQKRCNFFHTNKLENSVKARRVDVAELECKVPPSDIFDDARRAAKAEIIIGF